MTTITIDLTDDPNILREVGKLLATLAGEGALVPYVALPVQMPPIPPVAPAPSVPASASTVAWDARIHSASKEVNKDGTWRQRRNLDAAVLASVLAENTAALTEHTATLTESTPDPDAEDDLEPYPNSNPQPPLSFQELLLIVSSRMKAGDLSPATIATACDVIGLGGMFYTLSGRPDLIPAFCKELGINA